jgi:hypothetical protein
MNPQMYFIVTFVFKQVNFEESKKARQILRQI